MKPKKASKKQSVSNQRRRSRKAKRQKQFTHFTFHLPVLFSIQFTFERSDIVDPDADDPEISMNAIEQLQMEIQELLAEHYQVATVEVLDDALNAVFLGKDGD